MGSITIRNLPDEVHSALQQLAKLHGRSTESEVRMILAEAVKPKQRLGDEFRTLSREFGLSNADVETLDQVREQQAIAQPMSFEMLLLDTNIVLEIMKPEPNPQLLHWFNQQQSAVIATAHQFVIASRDIAPFEAALVTCVNPFI